MTAKGVAREEFEKGSTSSALLKDIGSCRQGLQNAIGKLPLVTDRASKTNEDVQKRYVKLNEEIGLFLQYGIVPEAVKANIKSIGGVEAEALRTASRQDAIDLLNKHEKAFDKFAKEFPKEIGSGKSLSKLNDALDELAESEERLRVKGYKLFNGTPERKQKKASKEVQEVNTTLDKMESHIYSLMVEIETLVMHRNIRAMLGHRNFRTEISDVAEHFHEHLLTALPVSLSRPAPAAAQAPQVNMPTQSTGYAFTSDFGKAWVDSTSEYMQSAKWAQKAFDDYTKDKKELRDAFNGKTLTEAQYIDLYKMLLTEWSNRNKELSAGFAGKIGNMNSTKDAIRLGRMALQSFTMSDMVAIKLNSGVFSQKELDTLNDADTNDFLGDDVEWNRIYKKVKKISEESGLAVPPTAHMTGDTTPEVPKSEWSEDDEYMTGMGTGMPPPPPMVGARP